MLTQQDLKQIGQLIDQKLEEKLEQKLEEKLEQKFNEKLKYLPSKDEFYEAMDKIMGELQKIRDEHAIQSYRVSDHEERITRLEEAVFKTPSQ